MGKSIKIFELQLAKSTYPGHPKKQFLEFVISGSNLSDIIDDAVGIGCLTSMSKRWDSCFRRQYRLEVEGELPNGRAPLYVCSQCADYYCGVHSCTIVREDQTIIWRDFVFENGLDEPRALPDVGPFRFEVDQYFAAIGEPDAHHVQAPFFHDVPADEPMLKAPFPGAGGAVPFKGKFRK